MQLASGELKLSVNGLSKPSSEFKTKARFKARNQFVAQLLSYYITSALI